MGKVWLTFTRLNILTLRISFHCLPGWQGIGGWKKENNIKMIIKHYLRHSRGRLRQKETKRRNKTSSQARQMRQQSLKSETINDHPTHKLAHSLTDRGRCQEILSHLKSAGSKTTILLGHPVVVLHLIFAKLEILGAIYDQLEKLNHPQSKPKAH